MRSAKRLRLSCELSRRWVCGRSSRPRRRLLDRHSTGLIAIGDRFVRIAFCSVEESALPELVRRLELAVAELLAAGR